MPDRRRSRSVLAVLVLVSLVLVTLDYRQGATGPLAVLQRGAATVFSPVQEGFSAVVRPIGGFFASIGQLGTLRDENTQLRQDLEALRDRQLSVADLLRENEDLRALVDMAQRRQFTVTGARVIGPAPGQFEWSVLIDVGADDGVQQGMAVVTARGLVGRIAEVTASHARVELATSPQAGYVARIAQTADQGFLRGSGARPFQFEVSNPEAEIPPDAEVVTHAFAGSRIPDGIPVGIVDVPVGGLAQGTRFLAVRPYVDFGKLGLVLVVLNVGAQPSTLPSEELVVDPDPPRPPAPDAAPGGDLPPDPEAPAVTPTPETG